ncbi:MAG: family 16 glycosylhydrolase [Muribaculaceae bacterium]|nr:family 16 glycosylhydrolase [Muribaculaceae bacterium]
MRKSTFISLFISLVGIFPLMAACGGSKDEPVSTNHSVSLSTSPESLSAGPEATTLDLTVQADADWAIRTEADWITLSPSGGLKNVATTIKVSVTANKEFDTRSAVLNLVSGGQTIKVVAVTQGYVTKATPSTTSVIMGAQESSSTFNISANAAWELTPTVDWISATPAKGEKGDTEVTVSVKENTTDTTREGSLSLMCGDEITEIKVSQLSDAINTPEGYTLVWSDEFNEGTEPSSDWVLENWEAGHVNNELQTYTSRQVDGKRTTEIKDGFLHINCFKGSDGKVYSGRMNAKPNTGWLYGYVEARISLPSGKGTWPAFWMMPSNVNWNENPWPKCGEIDIMEEVGANPNYVSSSLHTQNYNHTKGTQKTHEMKCDGAEGNFHTYALEWTEDAITTYVDGKVQLQVTKAQMGSDHDSWPFHYAFYPILNLAWGGDWGGYKGIDENALPVTMKVDYVRIFQKK